MAIDQKSFRRERVIVWQQHCKDSSCQSVRFFKILGFLDKIFNEKKQFFLFPIKFKRISSPMTPIALDANEL